MPAPSAPPRRWLPTLLLAWLPVGGAIILATVVRLIVWLGLWNRSVAGMLSVVPSAVVVFLVSRAVLAGSEGELDGLRGRMALVWGVASAVFRAVWVGVVLGGGQRAVVGDYTLAEGPAWLVLLGVIVLSPLIAGPRSRRAPRGA
jgi:hypothetical protein